LKKFLNFRSENTMKQARRVSIFFLVLLFIIFFSGLLNHSGEYGDQATENIFYQVVLDDFQKEKFDEETFKDFVKRKNQSTYRKQIEDKSFQRYGLAENAPISLLWGPENVKALHRLAYFTIDKILMGGSKYESLFHYYSLILLVLTFFIFFKLGQLILDFRYGIILASLISSNIYFLQLLYSSLEPQLNIYPFLLGLGLYSIFKYCKHKSKYSYLLLALTFGLSFLNGYPNTQLVLPSIIFLTSFLIIFVNKERTSTLLGYLLLSLIFGVAIYVFLAGIYGLLMGEGWFYHSSLFLIRINAIINGTAISSDIGNQNFLVLFFEVLDRIATLLFFGDRYIHAPHQPGMLLMKPFLNNYESLFLISFLFILLYKKHQLNSNIKILLITVLIVFLLRALTNDNKMIDKDSIDYFLLLYIPISYSVYFLSRFIPKIKVSSFSIITSARETFRITRKVFPVSSLNIFTFLKIPFYVFQEKTILEHNKFRLNVVLILILGSLFSNLNAHRTDFLETENEHLQEFSGFSELREYIKNNVSENDLVVFNYSHGYENIFYRLNFFNTSPYLMTLNDLSKEYKTKKEFDEFVKNKDFNKIFFIEQGSEFVFSKHVDSRGQSFHVEASNKFFDFIYPQLEIKNKRNIGSYRVYEHSKRRKFERIKLPPLKTGVNEYLINYDLNGRAIENLSVPGRIIQGELFCNNKRIGKISNTNGFYDYASYGKNKLFRGVKFINLNYLPEPFFNNINFNNIETYHDMRFESLLRKGGMSFISPRKEYGELEINIHPEVKIDELTVMAPYLIFNESGNYLALEFQQDSYFSDTTEVKSDNSRQWGTHTAITGEIFYPSYINKNYSVNPDEDIKLRFKMNSVGGSRDVRFFSNFHGYDASLFSLRYDGTHENDFTCSENLTIKARISNFTKVSDIDGYIGITSYGK